MSDAAKMMTVRVPERQRSKAPTIFAVLGLIVALAAGGFYFYQDRVTPQRTPEETVREFLSGVFLAATPERVAPLVCESWDPANAISRTAGEFPEGTSVSWDEVTVISSTETRATLRARIGVRQRDDTRPSYYLQWRFTLVKEDSWRVCEARPLNV